MHKRYSIAEARHNLAAIVHELADETSIELTRRGEPVAVLLSIDTYRRLLPSTEGFWEAYSAFRASVENDDFTDVSEVFTDVRDRSPGREVDP